MDPSGSERQPGSRREARPASEASLRVLDPRHEDRIRRRIVVATTAVGGSLALALSIYGSARAGLAGFEPLVVPAVALVFALAGLLTAWRRTRFAELALVVTGTALLLERLRRAVSQPGSDLDRAVAGYEMLAWLPCLYLVGFFLFDRHTALAFSFSLLAACAFIAGGGDAAIQMNAHGFYASHLFCILFVYALARLKERYVATHRLAVALRRFAETDFLTGVANRRSLTQALEREISRCGRQDSQLGVILLDVDRFKSVNDLLGHDEGDRTLRRVAVVMDRNRRRSDVFGRWGGEEFLLVAPDLDLEGARCAAERLRRVIEESSRGSRAAITASFGVACWVPGDDVASLVKRADEALIAAKTAGRNRVATAAA